MDLPHDRASIIVEEDRISNLPDEILHRILSFLDMKYAIQTSALSKKWKHIWTSMPYLNLNWYTFSTSRRFTKFVKHVLSQRNRHTDVSVVNLSFSGVATVDMKSIVEYAYLHKVRRLNMIWSNYSRQVREFPERLFSSHTLKHLTLDTNKHYTSGCCVPKSAWDFPALETLSLSNIQLCGDENLDLFSKCVNLKDLTLERVSMSPQAIFNVCAPQLSNLTITYPDSFPKVFNVVAPQLENLTASVCSRGSCSLKLSTEGLDSLEKVNLFMRAGYKEERDVPLVLDLFQKLSSAKFLIIDMYIIEALSSCPGQLALEPCPFNNLKCLKIHKQKNLIATMPTRVRNYFLESSPTATFIMDLPQVAWKRSREEEEVDKDTMANKVAKLEEEKQTQVEVIALQKTMLETMKSQNEKLMSKMINWKMAELQVQVASGNPDYELIRSMGRDIKSIMEITPGSLRVAMEAQFSCRFEEVKRLFFTHIDASQWAKIEMELGTTSRSERTNSHKVDSRSDVPVAALPPLPSWSSANLAASSTRALPDQY